MNVCLIIFFFRSADPDYGVEVRPEPVERLTSRKHSPTAAARIREGGRVEHHRQ